MSPGPSVRAARLAWAPALPTKSRHGDVVAEPGTLPQVYSGMQQARNPQSYEIPLSSLSDEEAESWRLVQRSAWGVRDTTGPGWLNVGESYTANVRFIERKDDALAELDQQIKLMGILSHATVDLGTTANDEVRQVLTNNGLDFLLRGMPFEMAQMPGQPVRPVRHLGYAAAAQDGLLDV